MSALPTVRRRVTVSGRVQMVGFRAFAVMRARELGLRGWVRNTESGALEAVVEGGEVQVGAFIQHLGRGPAAAEVRAVDVAAEPADQELGDFTVTP